MARLGPAAAQAVDFESAAPHAILVDAAGTVFYEKAADDLVAPASMAKIMTAIMVFDALKRGELSLDDRFLVSEDAWRRGGAPSGSSTMYAEINSYVSVDDLLKGAIIVSGNDACIALAQGMAGTESAFAARMTERARELGLTRSVFANATGLPDPNMRVTVRELALMMRYLIQTYPDYYARYYGETEFTWNDIKQNNRNPLLGTVQGVDGGKTGYTREAGYGLIASAERNGRRLILVVAGLTSTARREEEAGKLLAWGFRRFQTFTMFNEGETVGKARVWGGNRSWVGLVADQPVRLMLSPDERAAITAEIIYRGPLYAPVSIGDSIATLRFSLDHKVLSEIPLYAGNDIVVSEGLLRRAFDTLSFMMFGS